MFPFTAVIQATALALLHNSIFLITTKENSVNEGQQKTSIWAISLQMCRRRYTPWRQATNVGVTCSPQVPCVCATGGRQQFSPYMVSEVGLLITATTTTGCSPHLLGSLACTRPKASPSLTQVLPGLSSWRTMSALQHSTELQTKFRYNHSFTASVLELGAC